jgi:hypothetical protein
MSKKLNNLLENEISRFNAIIAYQDKMVLDEVSYRFYNEADEVTPEEPVEPVEDPTVDPMVEPMDAEAGADVPAEEPTDVAPEEPMTDVPTEQPADMSGEEVTEVDVTDLVNDTNEIKTKIEGISSSLERINDIMGKVTAIEGSLIKMDSVLGQLDALTKQVELMRPPTEEERRKALAQDSYPFNVSIDDYNKGLGAQTQTDLENSSKMSMMDTLMNDYNEMEVKQSFNIPTENPYDKL